MTTEPTTVADEIAADPLTEAAAFHGLATNRAYSAEERLGCALKALELYEALHDGNQWCECDAMRPVVEAARAWRGTGPWVSGSDVEYRLFAAVDALDGAS